MSRFWGVLKLRHRRFYFRLVARDCPCLLEIIYAGITSMFQIAGSRFYRSTVSFIFTVLYNLWISLQFIACRIQSPLIVTMERQKEKCLRKRMKSGRSLWICVTSTRTRFVIWFFFYLDGTRASGNPWEIFIYTPLIYPRRLCTHTCVGRDNVTTILRRETLRSFILHILHI